MPKWFVTPLLKHLGIILKSSTDKKTNGLVVFVFFERYNCLLCFVKKIYVVSWIVSTSTINFRYDYQPSKILCQSGLFLNTWIVMRKIEFVTVLSLVRIWMTGCVLNKMVFLQRVEIGYQQVLRIRRLREQEWIFVVDSTECKWLSQVEHSVIDFNVCGKRLDVKEMLKMLNLSFVTFFSELKQDTSEANFGKRLCWH